MPTLEVTLPNLHVGQRAVKDSPARYKVLACGRRWGKTRLGTALCLETALRGKRAWWVAPSYKLAAVGWRGVTLLARQLPGADVHQAERMITLPTGGTVQVSCDCAWDPGHSDTWPQRPGACADLVGLTRAQFYI